ncbi:MAG: FkbM family methyltransferase [Spirochaetota bacterium]|nr:FkbM family methyltransferase [Spirochaetota bacterium]
MAELSYLNKRFLCHINKDRVRVIAECGSRDGLDAIALYKYYYPAKVYVFECNPEAIPLCRENLKDYPDIKLIEKAVYDRNGIVDFFAVDMEKSTDKNIGASSMLWHRDNTVELFQKKIQVEAIRLDTFMQQEGLDKIDLICMDLQGAELTTLDGMGTKINKTSYIITEVVFEHFYKGDYLFDDVKQYMLKKGFNFVICNGFIKNRHTGFTDCLFRREGRYD